MDLLVKEIQTVMKWSKINIAYSKRSHPPEKASCKKIKLMMFLVFAVRWVNVSIRFRSDPAENASKNEIKSG
jgi:hypothetical protein